MLCIKRPVNSNVRPKGKVMNDNEEIDLNPYPFSYGEPIEFGNPPASFYVKRFVHNHFFSIALMLSALILLAGIGTSILYACWSPFQRSGSVLICLAAVLFFLDRQFIFIYLRLPDIEQRVAKLKPYWSVDMETFRKAHREKYVKSARDQLEKRISTLEISIVLVGTLIWGFGDLVPIDLPA